MRKGKVTEVRVKIDTKHFESIDEKLDIIEKVAEKMKKLEEKGEYRCTLLEVEI